MREIKFRTWHKEHSVMEYLPVFFPPNNRDSAVVYQLHGLKIMQFTGLKDKNGKEIYEGDILVHRSRSNPLKYPFIVKWSEKKAGWNLYPTRGLYTKEVIGNLYENPDLLK